MKNTSPPAVAASSENTLPECVRQFAWVVAGTAMFVFLTAFVSIPYALEGHPGEMADRENSATVRHLS